VNCNAIESFLSLSLTNTLIYWLWNVLNYDSSFASFRKWFVGLAWVLHFDATLRGERSDFQSFVFLFLVETPQMHRDILFIVSTSGQSATIIIRWREITIGWIFDFYFWKLAIRKIHVLHLVEFVKYLLMIWCCPIR